MKVVQLFELYNFHVDHFSKFQIDFELEIEIGKRGHFSEICIFKITLNFVLKLQKLKTPKLYILTRSTTLLLNSTSNFAYFLNCTKRGKSRVFKIRVFPPKLSENFHPRFLNSNTSIHTQNKHTLNS